MKLRSYFILFSIIISGIVICYSYILFQKNLELIKSEEKNKILIKADNVRFILSSFADNIVDLFNSHKDENIKIYFDTVNKITENEKYNLLLIKKELEDKYTDKIFNFYLINKDFVVFDTTFKHDLGLDFHNMADALDVLKKVYNKEINIDISWPMNEFFSKNYIQYFVHKPENKEFMIQMSIMYKNGELIEEYNKKIKTDPSLQNFSIYTFLPFTNKEKIYIENSLSDEFLLIKNKNAEIINIRKKEKEFETIYEKIFQKNMPMDTDQVNLELKNLLSKENGYLSYLEENDSKYYQIVLLPILNSFTFQNSKIIAEYLVMKFDITTNLENIASQKLYIFMFYFLFILLVLLSLYILYLKVLSPISKLSQSMKDDTFLNISDNNQNEINNMIELYNNLLKRLKSEITKKEVLLNENKQFIADTVHQIRTPLSNIMMNTDMIKLYNNADNKQSNFIEQIDASINMLNNSYEDLSYVMTYDTVEYRPSNISLSEILKYRVDFFNTISKVNHKNIILEIEENLTFMINHIELERLIDNNISNAIKYGDINKTITITLAKEKNVISLLFKTYGEPIKNSTKIFDKYYRENNAKKGLGLGLFMVKSICEKYNISCDVFYENNENIFLYKFNNQID